MESSARKLFRFLIGQPDDLIDVGRAALAIAAEEYPQLDQLNYLQRLDRLAQSVLEDTQRRKAPERLAVLIDRLSRIERFRGNRDEYGDPRNCFLNEVLDRRTGIPLSLSLVYILVGRKAGLSMHGISFPGHFLTRCDLDGGFVIVDPFDEGRQLSLVDCQRLLQIVQREATFDRSLLEPASHRAILMRMLGNLKAVYLKLEDWPRALSALDRMLLLSDTHPPSLRDRGLLLFQLGRFPAALRDLELYQQVAPAQAALDREALTMTALAHQRALSVN